MIAIAELGTWYRDKEVGFIGKATSICFNFHGETQVYLENTHGTRWIDLTRLEKAPASYQNRHI